MIEFEKYIKPLMSMNFIVVKNLSLFGSYAPYWGVSFYIGACYSTQ